MEITKISDTFQEKDTYLYLFKKYRGLLEMRAKFPICDKKALALVYTPGVAASCLEINKRIEDSFKYTNKFNSMLIVTDSSAGDFNQQGWNDLASIPYLEGISILYKKLSNIDCYPLIIKSNEIKDQDEFNFLIDSIMPCFSAIEFYNVNENTVKAYNEHRKKLEEGSNLSFAYKFARISSVNKHLINSKSNIHIVYAAALRVILDTQSYQFHNNLINELLLFDEKEEPSRVYSCLYKFVNYSYDYLQFYNYIFNKAGSYDIEEFSINKNYVLTKFERFITEGARGWVNNIPNNYKSSKETNDTNSLILHQRYKGVIESNVKIPFQSVEELLRLVKFSNFEVASKLILENPKAAKDLTCHSNLGAIITNGTAILGLGDIGALSGMPVMEGKSVLFKLYGGTDIIPFCIQEKDEKKFVRLVNLITPIFSIINLEDIRSPECFYIEPTLDRMVDFPVFHDDQHGTAIVVLAGIINSLKLQKRNISDVKVVMNGAGAAGLSVANLLITYGVKHFIICDTKGAIYKERKEHMNEFKIKLALLTNENSVQGKLVDVIKGADIFIGLSSAKELTQDMVRSMNKDPVIFALANPIPEIYPHEAYEAGAFIAATGRSDFPNQVNNSMAFPGIFRAAVDIDAFTIDIDMKIAASEGIANCIPENQLRFDRILPSAMDTDVFVTVAESVAKVAEKKGLIRRKDISSENVEENVDSWFHEGYLKTKF